MKTQKPYKRRAKIKEHENYLKLVIPVRRMWFLILVFLAVALIWGAAVPGFIETHSVNLKNLSGMPQKTLLTFAIVLLFNLFIIITLLWLLFRTEIIIFDKTHLKIKKKFVFHRTRKYDIDEIDDFNVKESLRYRKIVGFGHKNNHKKWLWTIEVREVFNFFYKNTKVKFGNGIDEAEAKYILKHLIEKGYLAPKSIN